MRMNIQSMQSYFLLYKSEKSGKYFQLAFTGSTTKSQKKNCICNDDTIIRMSKIFCLVSDSHKDIKCIIFHITRGLILLDSLEGKN